MRPETRDGCCYQKARMYALCSSRVSRRRDVQFVFLLRKAQPGAQVGVVAVHQCQRSCERLANDEEPLDGSFDIEKTRAHHLRWPPTPGDAKGDAPPT